MGGELSVKPVRAITWTDVGGREASLIQRCAARDEDACSDTQWTPRLGAVAV